MVALHVVPAIPEALPTVGLCFLGFLVVFVITAVLGSDGGTLSKEFPWQFRLAARMRTPVLVFIVVPLSFLQRQRVAVRRRFRRWQLGAVTDSKAAAVAAERHEANVSAVQSQLQAWNEKGRPCRLRTARPNWASMSLKLGSNKGECHLIETGHMNEILSVNAEDLTLVAEPGVTMGELTDVLLPMNLALQTHVEMESITLGGVAMGFGIETNSHRYGFFQESVLAYELLDSHGVRRQVTADSDPELFYALPWSHGTLGFLTCLTVRLVRTKPFIRMVYEPTYSAEQLTARLTELAARPWETPATGKSSGRRGSRRAIASVDSAADDARAPDFVEATMYDKDRAVIQAGWYVDGPPAGVKPSKINSFWKTFFFRHVETFLEKGTTEEFIPLKHFLHRFTRSIFWEIEDMIPFSNHPLYRCLWGWLGPPEVSLLKLFQGPVIRRASVYAHAVQESIMPIKHLTQGIEHFDEWFGAYPLLVFPVRLFSRGALSGFVNPRADECHDEHGSTRSGLWVDLGVYGVPRLVKAGLVWDAKSAVREMEHWTRDVGGFQALYTDIFCTPNELRQMFDFTLLDAARARLNCEDAFPEVYDKVKSEAGISDLSAEIAAEAAAAAEAAIGRSATKRGTGSRRARSPAK